MESNVGPSFINFLWNEDDLEQQNLTPDEAFTLGVEFGRLSLRMEFQESFSALCRNKNVKRVIEMAKNSNRWAGAVPRGYGWSDIYVEKEPKDLSDLMPPPDDLSKNYETLS